VAVTIGAVGTLVPPEAVTVTTEAAGRVAEVVFTEGDRVEAGELLVRLERDEDEARVREAEARVVQRRRETARLAELFARDFVSANEVERADAALQEAQAALAIAREALDERGIEAPFAGITGRRLVSPGAFLEAGAPITRLTQTVPLDLLFEVPGRQIAGLRTGLRVEAVTPAYPGETFVGEVTFVGAEVDPATRTLPLEATLPNESGRLKPGMFVNVSLVLESRDALTAPEAAVISRGPRQLVYRVEDGGSGEAQAAQREPPPPRPPTAMRDGDEERPWRVVTVTVETGVRRDGWVEIRSGLAAGDRVVTEGHAALRDGMRVRLMGEVER
jgi:membrane fusion protein (multidrug efflux system)